MLPCMIGAHTAEPLVGMDHSLANQYKIEMIKAMNIVILKTFTGLPFSELVRDYRHKQVSGATRRLLAKMMWMDYGSQVTVKKGH